MCSTSSTWPVNAAGSMTGGNEARPAGPRWLLAELTYRCPLHCVFCYNPVDYTAHGAELSTDDWLRVLREGRALGAIQLGFSGDAALLRDDLELLVAAARGGGAGSPPARFLGRRAVAARRSRDSGRGGAYARLLFKSEHVRRGTE